MSEEPEWSEPEVEVDEWTVGEKRELEKLEQKAEERRAREEKEAKERAERRALEPSPEVIKAKLPSLTVTGATGSTPRQVASGLHSPRAAITALSDWSRSKTVGRGCSSSL